MTVNEAVTRQWIRDNRDNIAWNTLGIKNVDRFANSLNTDLERLCELVDDEMGENTFEDFKARKNDAESVLGLKRCAYCHEMVADPIDSQPAGGKLCRGCERWFEHGDNPNWELDLERQIWAGIAAEMNRVHEEMCRAYEKAKESEKQWWADLRKQVARKAKHKKQIDVQTDDEDYQRAVDVRLSHGEDWRNL